MLKGFLAFVFAAFTWLMPTLAQAEDAWWMCSGTLTITKKDGSTVKNGTNREFKAASENEAIAAAIARWKIATSDDQTSRKVENVRCEKRMFSKKKAAEEFVQKPLPPLPTPTTHRAPLRQWTCRVRLTWYVGPRKGYVDETWNDIEADGEGAAMGAAIWRSQSRLKALSLKNTNPTWSATDAKCT